jgi:DNA repair protein RecO (recombination protein O)
MEYKLEAIVLSSFEVKEFDRIYNIFSKQFGRSKVLAKGVRRPQAKLAGYLEPMTRSEIFLVRGRKMDKVIGAIACDYYKEIKKDLEKTFKVKRLFDLINQVFPENEPTKEFYDELVFFLEQINGDRQDKIFLMQLALLWKMLKGNGYELELFCCGKCGKRLEKGSNFWFSPEAGVLCSVCHRRVRGGGYSISEEAIKILRIFSQKKMKTIAKLSVDWSSIKDVSAIIKALLENMLQKKIEL